MSNNEVIVSIEPELLDVETTCKSADLKPGHSAASLIGPKEGPVAPVVNGKRVLP